MKVYEPPFCALPFCPNHEFTVTLNVPVLQVAERDSLGVFQRTINRFKFVYTNTKTMRRAVLYVCQDHTEPTVRAYVDVAECWFDLESIP